MLKNNFFKAIKLKAFTISELLIALGVIAILTAVLMPIVHSLIPDQNTLMAKRAFYTVETVINALINDDGCYPVIRTEEGFTDGAAYKKCSGWSTGNANNANQKFSSMFIDKLDVKGNVTSGGGKTTFETKDGMQWDFQSIGFGSRTYTVLTIDVNGTVKGPNCGQNSESGACAEADRTSGFDKFTMHIHPSGKIDIMDCWAVKSVRTDKKLIGKFNEVMDCTAPPTSPLSCVNKPTTASDPCCASTKWRDKAPCSNDPCAIQPNSQDSTCCTDPRWSEKPPCYIAPPEDSDPCSNEPTDSNDLCCSDARYRGLGVCDACANAPTDKNDVCCSDSRWLTSLICDPCLAKPTSCNSTCCSDSRWSSDAVCDCCPNAPTSEDDACCDDNRYKNTEVCVQCPDYPSNSFVNNKCCEKWNSAGRLSKGDAVSQSCCNVTNDKFGYCTPCSNTPNESDVSEECCLQWSYNSLLNNINIADACCNVSNKFEQKWNDICIVCPNTPNASYVNERCCKQWGNELNAYPDIKNKCCNSGLQYFEDESGICNQKTITITIDNQGCLIASDKVGRDITVSAKQPCNHFDGRGNQWDSRNSGAEETGKIKKGKSYSDLTECLQVLTAKPYKTQPVNMNDPNCGDGCWEYDECFEPEITNWNFESGKQESDGYIYIKSF